MEVAALPHSQSLSHRTLDMGRRDASPLLSLRLGSISMDGVPSLQFESFYTYRHFLNARDTPREWLRTAESCELVAKAENANVRFVGPDVVRFVGVLGRSICEIVDYIFRQICVAER